MVACLRGLTNPRTQVVQTNHVVLRGAAVLTSPVLGDPECTECFLKVHRVAKTRRLGSVDKELVAAVGHFPGHEGDQNPLRNRETSQASPSRVGIARFGGSHASQPPRGGALRRGGSLRNQIEALLAPNPRRTLVPRTAVPTA